MRKGHHDYSISDEIPRNKKKHIETISVNNRENNM